jgi:uncharacterized protein
VREPTADSSGLTAESYDSAVPSFVCDVMLGSLARWLRLFGFDCLYRNRADDDELAELARREGRWLLTRDRALAAVGPRTQLVAAERLEEQLVEVFARHRLAPTPDLVRARCAECNGELAPVERQLLADRVPPYVLATAPSFRACTGCGRVYWPGTHGRRMGERMRRVVAALERSLAL